MPEEISYSLNSTRGKLLKETIIFIGTALNQSFQLGLTEGTNPTTGALYGFKPGESSAVVEEVKKFVDPSCMNGLDIGSGGNPIFPQTISVDYGGGFLGPLIQIHGDAKILPMFTDCSLDYVFSSHCWEDFTEEEKPGVLAEWTRVIKKEGFLMLLLPDEHLYRESCMKQGVPSNPCHKDADFGMEKARSIIQNNNYLKSHLKEHYYIPLVGGYSFFIVFKKVYSQTNLE